MDWTVRTCDGHLYDDFLYRERHVCDTDPQRNHVLFNKAKIRGVKVNREYFDQEICVSYCCQWFHNQYGETKGFRKFWREVQEKRYGTAAVRAFLLGGPNKIKER
jgi:hypothetical protein